MAVSGSELGQEILEYLKQHSTVVLSSSAGEVPWAAAVFYVSDRFDLYFFSGPDSRHSRDFAVNPRAAAAVNGHYWEWKEISGLQMEGTVEMITSKVQKGKALALYLKKYPFVKQFFDDPGSISLSAVQKVGAVEFYKFAPTLIYYLDNSKGFGERVSFTPPGRRKRKPA
jgi:uncharacterized protein YhbP (UPF0306 family)